jgi:hypothetical protein
MRIYVFLRLLSMHLKEQYRIKFLRTKLYPPVLKTQFVRRSKHSASVIETDKLML